MRQIVGKRLRAVWEIAVVVFGPTKNAPTVLRWWPIVLAGLTVLLPIVGLSVPGDLAFEAAWWVVIGLAVLVLLCFRALWILHAAVAPEFPRAEIDVKPFIHIHKDESDVDLDHTVLFFEIRVTNREPALRLNLVFDMSLRAHIREDFFSSFKLFSERDSRFENRLTEPLAIEPHDTVSGHLIYTWDWSRNPGDEDPWIDFAAPGHGHSFKPKRDGSEFLLTVHDYVSDGSITLSCPGTWSSPRSRRALETKTKTK